MSGLAPEKVVAYLNNVYSNPRYGDFDVTMAIEAATMRGIEANTAAADSDSAAGVDNSAIAGSGPTK